MSLQLYIFLKIITCKTVNEGVCHYLLILFSLLPDANNKYKVTVPNLGGESYQYFLNVCGELGVPCPHEIDNVAVCQLQGSAGYILGRPTHQILRYCFTSVIFYICPA